MQSDDPTVVRSLAVHRDDVVTALEANARRDAGAVLRVTPPFNGRMRARLHLDGAEGEYDEPAPLHVPPDRFVERVPPFPTPDETEDELRTDPKSTYTPERHRQHHEAAVDRWRRAVRKSLAASATVATSTGPHEVEITVLG